MAIGGIAGALIGSGSSALSGAVGTAASGAAMGGALGNMQDTLNQQIGFQSAAMQMEVAAGAQTAVISTQGHAAKEALDFMKNMGTDVAKLGSY